MRIDIYAGPSHEMFSPKSSEEGRGGSEEMVIGLAKELAKNNIVTVWNRCLDDEGMYDIYPNGNVTYKNYDEFEVKETDILVVWRSPQLYLSHKLNKVKAKKKYLWLHDTIPQLDVLPYLFAFDGIFVLSQWHRDFYATLTPPLVRSRYIITRNAVNIPDMCQCELSRKTVNNDGSPRYCIDCNKYVAPKRDPYTIVYGSLYNRGLMELLSVWPKVKSEVPEAKLRIFYGWETLEKIMKPEDFKKFKKTIEFDMDMEGITHLGRISHKQVEEEMLKAGIWAYPCMNFNEISCITAMRAQVCGTVPVVIPKAALNETVKYGIKIEKARDTGHFMEKFADELIKILKDTNRQEKLRKKMMLKSPKLFNFEDLAKQWIEIFNGNKVQK